MPFSRPVVFASLLILGVGLIGGGTAGSVPEQASDQGELRSHGPDPKSMYKPGRERAAAPFAVDAPADRTQTPWDGQTFTTDQADLTSLPTIHMIYLYPSDKPSRFSQYAAMFQADAKQASDHLANLYGRGLRFDYRAAGQLDITVVRSSSNARRLGGGNQFSLVANELKNKGYTNPNKKYAVWLDAGSNYCGQGTLYSDTRRSSANYNDVNRTTGVVYRPFDVNNADGGFCRGRTLAHEVGHNMGALQKEAPNAFDGAHCNDDQEDVMCYEQNATFDSGNIPQFDYNNDDYWDVGATKTANPGPGQKLPWWTLNLSKYVCPLAGCAAANSNPGY